MNDQPKVGDICVWIDKHGTVRDEYVAILVGIDKTKKRKFIMQGLSPQLQRDLDFLGNRVGVEKLDNWKKLA